MTSAAGLTNPIPALLTKPSNRPKRELDLFEHLCHLVGVGHVEPDCLALITGSPQLLSALPGGFQIHIGYEHHEPGLGDRMTNSAADPVSAAAGHHTDR